MLTQKELNDAYNKVMHERVPSMYHEAIIRHFFSTFKENVNDDIIAQKVCLLDMTYSTQIVRFKKVTIADIVNRIKELNFDARVQGQDKELVKELASVTAAKDGKITNLFSFASKYCCLHNFYAYQKDDYSIYDSVVAKYLPKYANVTSSELEEWRKNCDYENFIKCIDETLKVIGPNVKNKRRKFDFFLWLQKDN